MASSLLNAPVLFWLVPLSLSMTLIARAQHEDGFQSLFDGQTLKGWTPYGKSGGIDGWNVEDGILHRAAAGGDIVTEVQYADFDLRFEWKVAPGGNSGVMYRVRVTDLPAYVTGPEYQILDDAIHSDGSSQLTSAASLYGLYAPTARVVRPAGEWNSGRITVQGNKIQHWLNDVLVVEAMVGSEDWQRRVRESKFADWNDFARASSGHIALQDHGDEVWYRNLRIKVLSP
jgi:hypothetical protein